MINKELYLTKQEIEDYINGKINIEKENTVIDMPKNVVDKVTDAVDGVNVKKLNVEVEKDGKTYKVDVGSDKAKAEVK